ncbi:MAG: carbon storage regulator [Pirellulales bacterium]
MLVLTRKTKQQIQVGPNITITILQIKGQAVRVGIEAPQDVAVLRTELAQRLANGSDDPTVLAAVEKIEREKAISSSPKRERNSGRSNQSAHGSLRCRTPRVEDAPVDSPYQSMGPASLLRPGRRKRLSVR